MSKIETGGPAFPAIIPFEHSDEQGKDYPIFDLSGMSLRDHFAGQALAGLVERYPNFISCNTISCIAYEIADAMIAERDKE